MRRKKVPSSASFAGGDSSHRAGAAKKKGGKGKEAAPRPGWDLPSRRLRLTPVLTSRSLTSRDLMPFYASISVNNFVPVGTNNASIFL